MGGILHIVINRLLHLLFALRRVDSRGCPLRDIATTIELRTLATQPQLVKRDALALEGGHADLLRNDGIAATHTRKAGCLGERAELDGTFASTANLVDTMGNIGILDISLIGCIKEDEGIVLQQDVPWATRG